ncbi:PaaI family thioesterase [Metallumcola ferriviriculae]|uniref:Medium/long-chain acyl-CoA thioesterase YigI n=1 Tax=Metallumcola ferriviriculae TaxID=3039180 RepID=A0AAU0UML0_9FIRM|nr:PaaI family thioesterase [Desulfitibacteraceae bacterium MK1]
MESQAANYKEKVLQSFNKRGLIHTLGIEIVDFGPGWFHTKMVPHPKILQQHNYVHAGALATMADHTSGFASYSLMAEKEEVLTIEFKINLLRPAKGELIICRAKVLKPGRRIYVSESEVFSVNEGIEKLVAKATVTLAVVEMD